MIVLLYGPDSYRRKIRRDFYTSQFEKKYGIPAAHIDLAEDRGPERFEERAKSRSLFDARKLLVLMNIAELTPKEFLPLAEPFMESKESNLLISEDKKPVKAWDKLLKKPVIVEEFEVLKDAAWEKFVREEAKKRNARLSPDALTYLARAYAGDSWGLATELMRLAGSPSEIGRKELESMGIEAGGDYWALTNGLRSPQAAMRLSALQTILATNEPAAKVFNILAALWVQRTRDFAEYDKAIKFGRMDYEEALTDLVLS